MGDVDSPDTDPSSSCGADCILQCAWNITPRTSGNRAHSTYGVLGELRAFEFYNYGMIFAISLRLLRALRCFRLPYRATNIKPYSTQFSTVGESQIRPTTQDLRQKKPHTSICVYDDVDVVTSNYRGRARCEYARITLRAPSVQRLER